MNPLRPNTNAKEGNDEFLQLLRNRNCNSNDKPVFRRLLGYLNTESSNDQNDLCLRSETIIRNNKQINNGAKQIKPRPTILTSNNQKEEYTKEQTKHNTPEIDEVKNDSLHMEDLFVASELQTTSASIEDKQIVNANPFEMSKMEKEDKSLTITEDESVVDNNQDMLSCTSEPKNNNINTTDCIEIGSASIDIPRLEIETIGESILNKPENETIVKNCLRDKIKERRLRNRTICDFADLRLITDSHAEIATSQSSIEKTNASMNETINLEHEENEILANKIRNKRHRNRTICNEAFANVNLQEQPDSNSAETNNPLLDIKLINISIEEETKNREEKIASSKLDSVTSMAKSYENAIYKNNKATIRSKLMHTESNKVNETMVAEPAKTKHKPHSSDLSIASTNNQMISFNYTEKNKIDSYEMNVENQNVNAQVRTHILKESDNYIFGDEDEKVKQPKNKNEKAEITIHKSMSGIIESTAIVKPLECPINQMMRNSRSKHNDPTRFNRNIPFSTLNEKTSDLLTKYTRHQLEKEIRDKGVFAIIKRFFSKFFAKKWHEKNFVKMKKPDAFFNKLHNYILENYTKTPTMFRLTAERIYYTTYPEKAAKNEHIDFDALTPHQISALYKGYIRNIMKGFIPSKIAKNLVDYLKLDNISDEDKKKYLQTILPHLISDVERTHLKDIFVLWDMIADNFESTKMDIVSLCVVFGPSIINDDFIKDIRDSKYLATILECLYMSDLDRVDYNFYHKVTKKSKHLIKQIYCLKNYS